MTLNVSHILQSVITNKIVSDFIFVFAVSLSVFSKYSTL